MARNLAPSLSSFLRSRKSTYSTFRTARGYLSTVSLQDLSKDLLISTSMGHEIGGQTQSELVQSLIKSGTLSPTSSLTMAFSQIDRKHFVSRLTDNRDVYANRPLQLGFGAATLSTPQHHAQVLDALASHLVSGNRALDFGSGSGILSAVMAKMVGPEGSVLGIEIVPELIEQAQANLAQAQVDTSKVDFQTHLSTGPEFKFDCIHMGVALPHTDAMVHYIDHCLNPRGIMVVPVGHPGQEQMLLKITKSEDGHSYETLPIMKVFCQEKLEAAPVKIERDTRSVEDIQSQLRQWKDDFERREGRKPRREDLIIEPHVKALFQAFTRTRERHWDQ